MHCFNLTGFAINNFRVFVEKINFNIKPLTILTGTNSSGKSSLTKALHLLTESYHANGLRRLELMESNLKVGSFDSIKNSLSQQNEITFELEIEAIDPDSFSYNPPKYYVELNFVEDGLKTFKISSGEETLLKRSWAIDLKTIDESFIKLGQGVIKKEKLKKLFGSLSTNNLSKVYNSIINYLESNIAAHTNKEISKVDTKINNYDTVVEEYSKVIDGLKLFGKKENRKKVVWDMITEKNVQISEEVIYSVNPTFRDILPLSIIKITDDATLGLSLKDFVNLDHFNDLNHFPTEMLKELFNRFEFIEGVRATQEIVYTKQNSPGFYKTLSDLHLNYSEGFKKLKKWIVDEFKLIHLEDDQNIEDVISIKNIAGYGYMLQIKKDGKEIGLNGLGYGVSQLLPILIKVILKPESIFIIEEPESNLHPALQSKLADFFAYAIKKISMIPPRFIIETHSEYLIRKLQFLTAKKKSNLNLKSVDVIIYYFYHPDNIPPGEDQIKMIKVLENGTLSDDFGTGFFDESDNIAMSIWSMTQSQNN